jgi:hypothetical protein
VLHAPAQALRLARDMTDPELVKSLKDMAQEYCARADEIEKSALGEPAKDQFGEMCAANCGQLASTRTSWANKAKGIVVGTARPVEVANFNGRREGRQTRRPYAGGGSMPGASGVKSGSALVAST